jgi:hypothetical protein
MRLPDGATIEPLQRLLSGLHIRKAAQPHKQVWIAAMAELAENLHAILLLSFQEMALKQGNKLVAPSRFEGILAQLQNGAAYGWGLPRCVSSFFLIPAGTCL